MSITKRRGSKSILGFFAVVGALAVTLALQPAAHANLISGPVTHAEINTSLTGGTWGIGLQLSGGSTFYIAQVASPCAGVPALTADQIKIMLSIAQAALLSGKTATLNIATCSSGQSYIWDIAISQ